MMDNNDFESFDSMYVSSDGEICVNDPIGTLQRILDTMKKPDDNNNEDSQRNE